VTSSRLLLSSRCFRPSKFGALALALVGFVLSQNSSDARAESALTRVVIEQTVRIPVNGSPLGMLTRLCFPTVGGKVPRQSRLVVINHGSPANASDRVSVAPWKCSSQAASFFLQRGYSVAFPVRRGYGQTGGAWVEAFGSCDSADFVSGGLATASDIASAVDFLHTFPGISPFDSLVVGHSAGGFGTIAYASLRPKGVSALINVAGGRGGHAGSAEDESTCSPRRLAEAAGRFGRTARLPMLWLYADNDGFFSPDLVDSMYSAFTGSGGVADLQTVEAYASDGHLLFGGGGVNVWGPIFDSFLHTLK
jgi:pimeloyl-ACP methyl ester carboxylesterase